MGLNGDTDARVREQIERWARELIDLSRRNRSVYYRPLKRGTLEIARPSASRLYEQLVTGASLPVFVPPPPPEDEEWTQEALLERARPADVVSNRLTAKDVLGCLKTLHRSAAQDLMDRGVQTLYACFGMLEWLEVEGTTPVRSPLVFLPVTLEREAASDNYYLTRSDEDALLNPSLAVLLEEQFGVQLLPDGTDVQEVDSLDDVLMQVRGQITDRGGWRVGATAMLTRATFHKEAMYRDLLTNVDAIADHELVRSLAGIVEEADGDAGFSIPTEDTIDAEAPPEDVQLILDADASQRRAIEAARRGASFVMDGPPGTGKSQTIANMVAQLLADGRSVLFVSEKAAALEVVSNRLAAHGLQDYLLELHSHKASRKEVVKQLADALVSHPEARPALSKSRRDRARRLRISLSEYATAVNEVREPLGRSVQWVAGRLAQLADVPVVSTPSTIEGSLTSEKSVELLEAFTDLARVWSPVEDPEFAWTGFGAADLTPTQEVALGRQLDDFLVTVTSLQDSAGELAYHLGLEEPETVEAVTRLVEIAHHVRRQPPTERAWWLTDVEPLRARARELEQATRGHWEDVQALELVYGDRWSDLPAAGKSYLQNLTDGGAALRPPVRLPEHPTTGTVRAIDAALREMASLLIAIRDDTSELSDALGVPTRERTLEDVQDLAAVGARADAVVRPEPEWATPAVLRQVQTAIALLEPAVGEFESRHERVLELFTEAVFELDLPTIQRRMADVTGLGKLASLYRDARKELKTATRTGKVTPDVLQALPDAVAAQRARNQLDELEAQHGAVLGRHYQKRSTDTSAVAQAVDLLSFAMERLGDEYDPAAVAANLAGETPANGMLAKRAAATAERCTRLLDLSREVLPGAPDISSLALDEVARWIVTTQGIFGQLYSVLQLVQAAPDGRSLEGLAQDLWCRARIAERLETVAGAWDADRRALGATYDGVETSWQPILDGLDWTAELQRLLGGAATERTAGQLHGDARAVGEPEEVAAQIQDFEKCRDELLAVFDDASRDAVRESLSGHLADVRDYLGLLQDRMPDARVWADYRRLTSKLESEGWRQPLEDSRREGVGSNLLAEVLERALYAAWFDAVVGADTRLQRLRATDRDALVDDYRGLDRELLADASEQVAANCNAARPRTTLGAASVITREAQKTRRHMPVRKLLASTVEVASALKPCFMMSPLSVSQFLPSSHRFDVVIFDEASQIRPADAINCIYRGRQLVVAGDDRQLPPTSFFDADLSDDDDSYDEEAFDEFESVLGLCKGSAQLASLPLRWHYRSQHESLITFSNYRFYEGQLVTYPGAVDSDDSLGVELFAVDGTYRRGGRRDNPAEAAFVASRVLHHARLHPGLSLGVVALSKAQAEAIEDAVDRLRQDHPEIESYFEESRLDGFFVKNLENVQGDERDLMILSVGYGPDEVGKFTMNFGPINREGGWRRLNVAVTRARRRLELVASFTAADMTTGESRSRGLAELQRYVDYADRGASALAIDLSQSDGDVESPLEASILGVLRSWGYEVVPQLGSAGYRIDLAVRDPEKPGRFLLAIEADGAAYHSSKAARDRDRLRQEVLEGLGWTMHRVWGPSWYRDRAAELVRLREALEAAQSGNGAEAVAAVRGDGETVVRVRRSEEVALESTPTWAAAYEVAQLRGRATGRAHDPGNTTALREAVRTVVAIEAPVHLEVIGRRVADHWGHNLTRTTRREVQSTALYLQRQGELTIAGEFVWTADQFDIRVPGATDASKRDIQNIPPEEVQEAVHRLLLDARVCTDEEILQGVKDLFGFRRMGANIARALETALAALMEQGWIERGDDGRLRALEA